MMRLLSALLSIFVCASFASAQTAPTTPVQAAPAQAAPAQAAPAQAAPGTPAFAQALFDRVTPSLVAVQFSWTYEFGKVDLVGPGVVISTDGLVLVPGDVINAGFPDAQLTDFKIIIPGKDSDDEEIDAVYQGRDRRNNVALVRAKSSTGRTWTPIKFEDQPLAVGDPLYSVGILAKAAGYRTFLSEAVVAAHIRGEIPNILVSGSLSALGAPVFTADGKAIGLVNTATYEPYLYRSGGKDEVNPLLPIVNPPRLFTPTSEFIQALTDPPTPENPLKLPWVGWVQLTGLSKDVAQVFGLANQPAIEVGDVVPGGPADSAGIKVGMKIVKINGKPLTRGDEPQELPQIMHRQLMRMKIGDKVTFSLLQKKGEPLHDITVTLGQRPAEPPDVKRYYADDLGFGVREITFDDTYPRRKPANFPGVVVTLLKPSGAAQTAKLSPEDLITDINNTPVTDLTQFQQVYESLRADKPKDAIVLVAMKPDGSTETIRIEPPQ
jgi:serine protease Do